MSIEEIAKIINDNGGNLYLVGGAVRDEIMGFKAHDEDYCVEGLDLSEFVELFPEAKIVGNDFPVFLLNGCEFALARTEEKVSKGYKGFKVRTSKDIKIEEDLKRRDITINAMAKNVLTGEIIDPFNGMQDIENKTIRHVSDAFSEDPLRAYRVARFAAKYDFKVDPDTLKLMNKLKDELKTMSPDRVFLELRKVFQTNKPSNFFRVLKEADLLNVHFKEIRDLINVPQPEKYHPEGDVFNHTMLVLDKIADKTKDEGVMFSALVHDLGKAKTPKNILPSHYNHDKEGEPLVETLSNRLKLPNKWKKMGKEACRLHMVAGNYNLMRPYKKAVFLNTVNKSTIGLDGLELLVNADDMINREEVKFADFAKDMFKNVNGNTLLKKGITAEIVGNEEFVKRLLTEQAEYIKEYEKGEIDNQIK